MRLFRIPLAYQMLIGMILGIFCGLFFGERTDVLAPYASAYVMLLKITALPYLIAAIIYGIGQLEPHSAKLILKKGISFILMAWVINIVMIYAIYVLFPRSTSFQYGGYPSLETPKLNFAHILIPENIFSALTHNVVPAIVIFSLAFGIALIILKSPEVVMVSLHATVDALTKMTSWIARITPIGTFLIIAQQAGMIHLATFKQVGTYVLLYILGTCIVIFWIFPRLVAMFTSIPAYKWFQQMFPILLLVYTTNVIIVALPYIIELLKRESLLLDPSNEQAPTQVQGVVSVVFNLPLASLFVAVFVFFVSIFYNMPLSASSQVQLFFTTFLTGLGSVGLGAWVNSLSFILNSLGLPITAVNLFLTTMPFTSGFQSMLSAMEIAALSLFIILSCRGRIRPKIGKLLANIALIFIPIFLLVLTLKLAHPLPEIKNETKSIYELSISSTIPVKVHKTPPPPRTASGDVFDEVQQSKVLRVGFNPQAAPYCFYNVENQVVGYDIAYAYELAYDLGVRLELIPLDYAHVDEELNTRLYDIAMSAVNVDETRLRSALFTQSYMSPRIVLITNEARSRAFSSLEYVKEHPLLKVAVIKGTTFEKIAREHFPEERIVYLNSEREFESQGKDIALLWEEYEALAWMIRHKGYKIVLPEPSLGKVLLSYPIPKDNPRFLDFLNTWLALKQSDLFHKQQAELWIQGKTEIIIPYKPRWSIIRDVLHWVD